MSSRVRQQGMGYFMHPPDHPAHKYSVEIGCDRPLYERVYLSLLDAVHDRRVSDYVSQACLHFLDHYMQAQLPMEHERIQQWVVEVLHHYSGCCVDIHIPPPLCFQVKNLVISEPGGEHKRITDTHAGVCFVRQFYSGFTPTQEHWDNALRMGG